MKRPCAIALLGVLVSTSGFAKGLHERAEPIDHVLLISIDGLHALDVSRFVKAIPSRRWPRSAGTASPTATPAHPPTPTRFPGCWRW